MTIIFCLLTKSVINSIFFIVALNFRGKTKMIQSKHDELVEQTENNTTINTTIKEVNIVVTSVKVSEYEESKSCTVCGEQGAGH